MGNLRSKASENRYSGADATDYSFNQYAGGLVVVGPTLGKLTIMGALNTAKSISISGANVAVYNNSTTTAFVKTGNSSVTAPTGGADGICLAPNSYTIIAMGTDTHIISSAATCFGYEIKSDLNYNPNSGINN